MTLNLVKLCVGISSIEEFQAFIDYKLAEQKSAGLEEVRTHVTRMVPKRMDELLDGGSLYWVIKGNIQCRQIFTDIQVFTDNDGIRRCRLVMEPRLILTEWQPRRAFQGWRYLKQSDAPGDMASGKEGLQALPPELRLGLSGLVQAKTA